MAAVAASNMDSLVTLKVNLDGSTRRFKLPLRDMGANGFENKLRAVLTIPRDTECLIERYSDSAAAYVVLDRTNVSVYKQLYRAAKAKQKLKLRITTKETTDQEKKGPLPASVEDEPEAVAPAPAPALAKPVDTGKADKPPASLPFTSTVPLHQLSIQCPPMESRPAADSYTGAPVGGSLAMLERNHRQTEQNLEMIAASIAAIQNRGSARESLETLLETQKTPELPTAAQPPMCEKPAVPATGPSQPPCAGFAVCCNSCDKTIPNAHYHCSTCDDGDFDLCQDCVDQGITCYGSDHWLLKRFLRNGTFVNSTTETIAPKPKAPKPGREEPAGPLPFPRPSTHGLVPILGSYLYNNMRTCNSCVDELPDAEFVHCTTCADFDLCKACFAKNQHGHHPKHGFVPAVENAKLGPEVTRRLAPGRNQSHNAICDGCDKDIQGVRHKCLDCPDWDYCSGCVVNARYIHPAHRFVQVYEPLESPPNMRMRVHGRPIHAGICCDGPLCFAGRAGSASAYITGIRYKCAVCFDTDFCANCEASPSNTHNKTHPLIKFKTPVKQVTVTTTGQNGDGQQMPTMGDHVRYSQASTSSRSTETTMSPQEIVQTNVVTVADMQPSEPATPVQVKQEVKREEIETTQPAPVEKPAVEAVRHENLAAVYEGDTIADGTILPPNHVFEQTWVIRNQGDDQWPSGCSARFVGGDYMGHVDPNHPAGTQELASASESTVCEQAVAPREVFRFSVVLRTPAREGRVISYWRLTTKDGFKFGPRLWCDVNVQAPKPNKAPEDIARDTPVPVAQEPQVEPSEPSSAGPSEPSSAEPQSSQMIFPRLDKESPDASIHEENKSQKTPVHEEDYEDCDEDDEWAEDHSDEGFLTDEEYDILDASDEEYLEDQEKQLHKK